MNKGMLSPFLSIFNGPDAAPVSAAPLKCPAGLGCVSAAAHAAPGSCASVARVAIFVGEAHPADSAIVIDSNGRTSDQMDVVIYDPQYTPMGCSTND